MTLGPQITQNKIYSLIKSEAKEFISQDIASFYTSANGKEVRLQLGGYEEMNAKGHGNGVLFYEKSLLISDDENSYLLAI